MKHTPMSVKVLAWLSLAVHVALGVGFGIANLVRGEGRVLLGLGAAAFLLVPPVMKKLLGAHPYRLYILVFLFCVLAYDFGCVNQMFDAVAGFDKLSHFLSGLVFTPLGFCLYYAVRRPVADTAKANPLAAALFALFFSAFVAVFWEICEFTGYVLTGHDSQHHEDTGVFDTMWDLITCMGGSLLSALSFLVWAVGGKLRLLSPRIAEEFHYIVRHNRRGRG